MRITCVHALATICIMVKYSRIICPLVDSLVGIKCSFQHRYSDIQHKLIIYVCSMLSLDSVDNVASIVFAVFDSTARLTKGSISCRSGLSYIKLNQHILDWLRFWFNGVACWYASNVTPTNNKYVGVNRSVRTRSYKIIESISEADIASQ